MNVYSLWKRVKRNVVEEIEALLQNNLNKQIIISIMIERISDFLREIADKMDNNELSEVEQRRVSEFYMRYKFQREVETEDEQLEKYLSLGWYVYTQLL